MTPEDFESPTWQKIGKVRPHQWKNYVSEDVRRLWQSFNNEQKKALAECFEEIASREEWD